MNNHFSEMCIRPLLKCEQKIALIVWCVNVVDVPQLGENIIINFFVTSQLGHLVAKSNNCAHWPELWLGSD